jgi:hypothetical protein
VGHGMKLAMYWGLEPEGLALEREMVPVVGLGLVEEA